MKKYLPLILFFQIFKVKNLAKKYKVYLLNLLYNQAYKTEYDTNYELAGCGYRNVLKVLIKDYAINILEEKKETV